MKRTSLDKMSAADLVERFGQIVVAQDEALLGGETTKFKRLYGQMMGVVDELKSREGDQRVELLKLFHYPNMQVRLQAARLTMAVAPVEARAQLEAIAASKWFPQAGDAGMSLWNLDNGVFKPT